MCATFRVTVLADGCAAFSPQTHAAAIEGLRPVAVMSSVDEELARLRS